MWQALETTEGGIPTEFVLRVPDEWVKGTLKAGLVFKDNGDRLPETLTRFRLTPAGFEVTVRADSDPDSWPTQH